MVKNFSQQCSRVYLQAIQFMEQVTKSPENLGCCLFFSGAVVCTQLPIQVTHFVLLHLLDASNHTNVTVTAPTTTANNNTSNSFSGEPISPPPPSPTDLLAGFTYVVSADERLEFQPVFLTHEQLSQLRMCVCVYVRTLELLTFLSFF